MNETNVYSTILGGCWLVMTTTTGCILGNLPLEDGITINILNPIIPNPQVWAGCQFGCFPLNNIVVGHVDKNAMEMIMWRRFRQRGSGYWLWHMSSLESMVTKHWNSIDWEVGGSGSGGRGGWVGVQTLWKCSTRWAGQAFKRFNFFFFSSKYMLEWYDQVVYIR